VTDKSSFSFFSLCLFITVLKLIVISCLFLLQCQRHSVSFEVLLFILQRKSIVSHEYKNLSGDEIANVKFFTTTSYMYYKIQ